jgi:hypothetical protein
MAIEVLAQVLEYSEARLASRLVLIAIANYADENGNAYPSVKTIASRARISPRQVQRCIQDLEKIGELTVQKNASQYGTNLYSIKNFTGDDNLTPMPNQDKNMSNLSPKPLTKPIDSKESINNAFILWVHHKFDSLLGSEHVDDQIEAALNHVAYKKALNKRIYLRRWLERDLKGGRRFERGKHGSIQNLRNAESRWASSSRNGR